MPERQPTIKMAEMPSLYRHADATAAAKQRTFLRITCTRLALMSGAAAAGAFAYSYRGIDLVSATAAAALAAAGTLELVLWQSRPEKTWYRARALAESVKTLAWRYAMRAEPFQDETHADERFLQRLAAVRDEVKGIVAVLAEGPPELITPWMREMRAAELAMRQQAYLRHRIDDQLSWYARKTAGNNSQAARWSVGLLVVNALGAAVAVLKSVGLVTVDILGVLGAVAAASVAWVQTRQYTSLAAAYATTHHELLAVRERVIRATGTTWAREVSDAEDAISREHTMWQASRSDGASR